MDIEAGIKKLIECSTKDKEHCNNYVTRAELLAVLEAMRPKQQGTDPCEVPLDTVTLPRKVVEEWMATRTESYEALKLYFSTQDINMVLACRKALEEQK